MFGRKTKMFTWNPEEEMRYQAFKERMRYETQHEARMKQTAEERREREIQDDVWGAHGQG